MRVAIRVDASHQIGTGHFMRCLTLADALKKRGAQIRFVSRHLPGHLQDMLKMRGHEFAMLEGALCETAADELAHAHWLGVGQEADAQGCIEALADHVWEWLVVDHYALDTRWESELQKVVKNILVIDDLADRVHACDVLLDQNFYGDMDTRYVGKVPAQCRLLLGPRYALLRDEFRQWREQVEPRKGAVRRLLVFFGGVDAANYTGRTVGALAALGIGRLLVDVVIGEQHPCREQIELTCAQHQFICHVQTNRMAELMAAADLSIGAGGSATWERCCLGLPTFVICTANNQRKQVDDAASEGWMYAPEANEDLALLMRRHLAALLENKNLRYAISNKALRAVDGRGTLRVIEGLNFCAVKVRPANEGDSEKLFEWRNHPAVRAVSRNASVIDWENHRKWFASVLSDPDRLILVGQIEDAPIGVVRFDMQSDEAEVSIYLAPDITEPGLGRDLLLSAEGWLATNRSCTFRAHVLGGNERSQRLFSGAGYQVETICFSKRVQNNEN